MFRMEFPFHGLGVSIGAAGGKAKAFVPSDLAGLALWLKSDAGLYQDAAKTTPAVADADPIGAWADQSGNGRDVTQATAGNRPVLKLNIQNGRAVVRFDGSNDFLSGAIPAGAAQTLFMVVKKRTAAGATSQTAVAWDDGTAAVYFTNTGLGATHYLWYSLQAGGAGNLAGVETNWNIVVLKFASAAALTVYYNGSAGATVDPSDTYASSIVMSLGATTNGSFPGDYDFGEEILYDSALSDANRAKVEAYLNARWAIY